MVNSKSIRVIGVGNPIVDLLARVDESFVESIPGEKGGMGLVSPHEMEGLLGKLGSAEIEKVPGGSAANTVFAMARLGAEAAMIGKIRRDEAGEFYQQTFRELGGDTSRFKFTDETPTARCLSLVTPDSQRTMRTDLGAAALLEPGEIEKQDFESYQHAHLEGYLFFNSPELFEKALHCARSAGCTVSVDLGSFEVVKAMGQDATRLLRDYVDFVFANEEEAEQFCGDGDPQNALRRFAEVCDNVAVKLGAEGSLLSCGGRQCRVDAQTVDNVLDTTGAGDLWAAGFLYGYLRGSSLEECGHLGAALGAEVVQCIGPKLPPDSWDKIGNMLSP